MQLFSERMYVITDFLCAEFQLNHRTGFNKIRRRCLFCHWGVSISFSAESHFRFLNGSHYIRQFWNFATGFELSFFFSHWIEIWKILVHLSDEGVSMHRLSVKHPNWYKQNCTGYCICHEDVSTIFLEVIFNMQYCAVVSNAKMRWAFSLKSASFFLAPKI